MKTYVALLRGINVGGKNIIKMVDLAKTFEELGFSQVRTYIQSGNVIFQSDNNRQTIEEKIENHLRIRVLVRTTAEMEAVVKHFPRIFKNNLWKHNIIFLGKKIDKSDIVIKLETNPVVEESLYYKGVLYWSAKLEGISRSKMLRLSQRDEYKEMTVRNVNTTVKLLEIMRETDG